MAWWTEARPWIGLRFNVVKMPNPYLELAKELGIIVAVAVAVLLFMMVAVLYIILKLRWVIARIQSRLGPNRTGYVTCHRQAVGRLPFGRGHRHIAHPSPRGSLPPHITPEEGSR